jgi:HPt (histidine-containing phosphotransfer) domain-containing protein
MMVLPQRIWTSIVLLFVLLGPALKTAVASPSPSVQAVDGVFDFSGWDFNARPLVRLEGDVPFYWKSFQISAPDPAVQAERIRIPGSWHKVSDRPLYGHATYVFELVSDREQIVSLDLGLIGMSHRIYINDQLVHGNGEPAAESATYRMASANKILFSFTLAKGSTRLTIEAANHDYILAGLTKPLYFGTPEAVLANRLLPFLPAFLLFGAYLAIGLYHFGLFSLRRRDRSSLYFGLFCLASIPSILVNNQVNSLDLVTTHSVAFAVLLASSLALAMAFLGFFLAYLYEDRVPRLASQILLGVYLILTVASFYQLRIFLALLVLLMAVGLPAGFVYIYSIIRAVKAGRQGAGLMLVSICTVLLTAVNDYANFKGWIDSIPLSAIGSLAFLMIQSYLLSARFSRAFMQIEISEREVRQLSEKIQAKHAEVLAINENLEHLAEEKTRDIRSILAHIQLGIFAIQPERFQIHKDHSQHMREIFEVDDISRLSACDLLFARSQLTSDETSQAVSALQASLGENALVFQLNSHCLPQEIHYQGPSGRVKLLELSWHPVIDQDDCIEKILVTVRDVTQLRALEEEAQDKKEELQFISELLNISAEAFRQFMQNADDFMKENRKLINSQSIQFKDMEVLKVLFINMHTMKGAARSLYLKKMTRVFHDVEQYYAQLQSAPDAHWDIPRMNKDLDEAEAILRTYESINQGKLGRKTQGERDIALAESSLMNLYQEYRGASGCREEAPRFMQSLQTFFISSLFTPVYQLLLELCQCTETLAKDLKKEKPRIHLDIADLHINGAGDRLIRKILVHLLRNSMDHGIEAPADRARKQKPVAGTISMSARRQDDAVVLIYQDDGRGLDLDRIEHLAREKKLIKPAEPLTWAAAGELMFYPGLSTASQVSDVSGRGVGMDAVRSYLEKLGGSITVQFLAPTLTPQRFQAFRFEIRLPGELFSRPLAFNETAAA